MSLKTKKRFKNIAKIIGGILFVILFFTNIKIALMENEEKLSGNISLLGLEIELFQPSYAEDGGNGPNDHYAQIYYRTYNCGFIVYRSCPCYEIRCLYGGSYCTPYTDCP